VSVDVVPSPGPAPHDRADPDDALVARVEEVLSGYLDRRSPEVAEVHPSLAEVTDALTGFVLSGGKRVRPTFAWWGWRGAGGDPHGPEEEAVLRVVSALELIQACALVHDDLIDASDTRRGRSSVHVDFAGRHRERGWQGPADRFGAAAAVLIGDLALAWADDLVDEAGLAESAWLRARPVWSAMRTEVLSGQLLDTWCQASRDDSADAALRVDRFKTAAYTVERPLHLGAALAGAPAGLVTALRRYGADVGVAFQLRDDLLGVFGDPEVTGKPAGDDLREGKRTLLTALALDAARTGGRHAEADLLTAALGDQDLDDERLDRVRAVLHELGAVRRVEARITELTESGLAALAAAEVAAPAGERLRELADAATRRRS
jgi:geranylgeranyl diphosphate synthase type I